MIMPRLWSVTSSQVGSNSAVKTVAARPPSIFFKRIGSWARTSNESALYTGIVFSADIRMIGSGNYPLFGQCPRLSIETRTGNFQGK
jgi:hypothetical protein